MNEIDDLVDAEENLTEHELIGYADKRTAEAPVDSAGYKRTGPMAYGTPDIDGHWPCRNCKQPSPVTATAVEMWAGFNRILRARGEAPIDSSLIAVCNDCQKLISEKRTAHATRVVTKLRESFVLLRDGGGTQEEERAAEDYLRRHDNFGNESIAAAHALRNKKRGGGGKADW